MILYNLISGFINSVAVMFFGVLVLWHNPRDRINRLMGLLCASVVLWAIGWFFLALSKNEHYSLFFMRLLNLGAVFIPIFFLHWVLVLLEIEKKNKSILLLGYIITLFFLAFVFTPYFITIKPKSYFYYYAEAGIIHPFYLGFSYFGLVGYALYRLLKSYKRSIGYKKAQIKYILLGSILGFGGGSTNFLLFYNVPIPPFGNPFVAVGFGLLAYAVIRYRLMDIRIFVEKVFIYGLSFITVILVSLLLVYFNARLTRPLSISTLTIFIVFLSIFLFQIYKFYKKIIEQYFPSKFYNTKITISNLEERLMGALELETFSNLISNTLRRTFNLSEIVVLIKRKENYEVQGLSSFNEKKLWRLVKNPGFISILEKNKKVLVKEDKELKNFRTEFKKIKIEACLPFVFKKEIIGILFLGNKKSGDVFSSQDLRLLNHLLRQAAIALKNASLFAEINKRKEELESFYRLTVNRELEILRLKKIIKELNKKLKK